MLTVAVYVVAAVVLLTVGWREAKRADRAERERRKRHQ